MALDLEPGERPSAAAEGGDVGRHQPDGQAVGQVGGRGSGTGEEDDRQAGCV